MLIGACFLNEQLPAAQVSMDVAASTSNVRLAAKILGFFAWRCTARGYRLLSMQSQIVAAISGPPRLLIARKPVGDVTLISVR